MSERIVNDPSQHGWVEESGKWVWDGTDSGAGMIISETEPDAVDGTQWLNALTGEVFIYDDGKWLEFPGGKDGAAGADGKQIWSEVTEDGDIYYDKGNVGIGRNDPQHPLDVYYDGYVDGNKNTIARFTATGDKSRGLEISSYTQSTAYGGRVDLNVKGSGSRNHFSISLEDTTALEFNTSGDATFTGNAEFQGGTTSNSVRTSTNGSIAQITMGTREGQAGRRAKLNFERGNNVFTFGNGDNGDSVRLTIASNGDATFSGTVTVEGNRPVSTKLDIIKTLSTLRNATKDETTLEGLRDSIGNAIGGLIEEFENQIATMPAEDEA